MTHDLLILGDFGGRGHDGRSASEPLARRRTRRIDRDDLDEVMAAISPELRVEIIPGADPTVLRFSALDDFHPDRLAERVPLLRQLRAARAELAAPGRVMPPPQRDATPSVSGLETAAALSAGSLLDRIVDDASGAPAAGREAPRRAESDDDLSRFVRRAVEAHAVGEIGEAQREQLAQLDDVIAATLRVILHHPDVQALESLWRGVDLITRRVETGDTLHITVADVTQDEIVAALADESDASAGGLRSLLEAPSAAGADSRWSVVIAAHTFGPGDVSTLGRLAGLARDAGVPWLAAAEPSLAGATSFGDGSDVDDWDAATTEEWDALRRSDAAPWLALALPRFLARVPYGDDGERCEVVPFEEFEAGRPDHESLLWGNAALLCAIVLGESGVAGEPWATHGTIDRLPFQVIRVDGEPTAIPCAEALLSQRSVMHLLDRGLTALASARDGDAVRIPRLQSVAQPPAPLAFARGPRGST